ncbi:MAG: hypothetical protein JNM66_33200 [Bryobacterales bacterium]|nr:hypothetical protein [Bryobacterales bacterium]
MRTRLPLLAALFCLSLAAKDSTVYLRTKDGASSESVTSLSAIRVTVDGKQRSLPLASILSIHNGDAASASEAETIEAGIVSIQGADRAARDLAVERLTAIGIPVMTPLLKAYKDTDQHEPRPLYRLFERIMPSHADQLNRQLSLIRLASGESLRGEVEPFQIGPTGWNQIRLLAIKQKSISRRMDIHSLRHSTQIEYFDTAVIFSADTKATITASGFTRLSWETDGWATGPNGLQKPGPNYKTNLVDGHPFGALVGRFGATGNVFFVGATWRAPAVPLAKLFLAINDNRHWQNNLGAYRATLSATGAYDIGDPQ